ncbi:MAG: ABC transporter ATP-binding protein [Planctomycetota bacterium]|jgi:ABC-2 type transport system ATP-binding protein
MSEAVVQIKGLVKYFDGRCVLNGINLDVERGCIYGLLGRNGAGKTTIIRILMGLENASRGETYLLGSPSVYLPNKVKGRVGYVAEAHNLIQNYRVNRLVQLCKDLSLNWNEAFFKDLIKRFRLPLERKVKELSMGMRAQLNLSLAMAIEPEVLILDDPTLGLDTVSRREFLELAVDVIQREGRTILFCSHILSDVERIADRIGILCAGKLVVDCGLEELKERVTKLQLIFKEAAPKELYMKDIINQKTSGREMIVTVANLNKEKRTIIETFGPESCTEISMSLEDIFIECTRLDSESVGTLEREIEDVYANQKGSDR